MNPELIQRAKDAAGIARGLAERLGSQNPVAKSAAALAADCLELAVSPFAWQTAHEIVRDLGVRNLRESVQRDCAAAMLLAADSARRLGVHGDSAERHAAVAERLEQLASNLMRTGAGLDDCELKIIDRLKEPRLAEISLQNRSASLRMTPSEQSTKLRQLSTDLERNLAAATESRANLAMIETRLRQAEDEIRANSASILQAETALQHAQREVQSARQHLAQLEFERDDIDASRRNALQRLAEVRLALEASRDDPRDLIRSAVRQALALLPADSLDESVGGSHA